MKKLYINILVFMSGAAVLAIEILGTRILGPFYGVSIFLWSALIAVTLLSLSVGYTVGGRWADSSPRLSRICLVIATAGVWMLLLPVFIHPVLSITEGLGLRVAVLLASIILFAPPLTLLGIVTPYAIKLRTENLGRVGKTSGNLFAISTIGSVISGLLTGYFLIPFIGVRELLFIWGITLVVLSLFGLISKKRSQTLFVILVLVTSALVVYNFGGLDSRAAPRGIIAERQSRYAELCVLDWEGTRYLLVDGAVHTMVDTARWKSQYEYVVALELTKYFYEQPGRLLLIGLGGGSVVKNFNRSGWLVDAVEIDPAITQLAFEYFGLLPSEVTVHTDDGRRYLRASEQKYDLIILDAFGSSSIPFHLVTEEAFALAAGRLDANGIIAINVESVGWRDQIVRAVGATLRQLFRFVIALPTSEPRNALGNMILMASNRPFSLEESRIPYPQDYLYDPYQHWFTIQLNHSWFNRFPIEKGEGQILRDDLNPVDIWSERVNLEARKSLHEYFQGVEATW